MSLLICLQYCCPHSSFFQHNPSFSTSLHLFPCFNVSSHLQPHQVASSNHFGLWGVNWTIYHLVLPIFSGGLNSYINLLLLFNFSHFPPFCLFNLNATCLPCWGCPGALPAKVWAKVNRHQIPQGSCWKDRFLGLIKDLLTWLPRGCLCTGKFMNYWFTLHIAFMSFFIQQLFEHKLGARYQGDCSGWGRHGFYDPRISNPVLEMTLNKEINVMMWLTQERCKQLWEH